MIAAERLAGSFRDPSGFIFHREGELYRQINPAYAENWRLLERCGLLAELIEQGLLVTHELAELSLAATAEAVAVIRPEPIPFISYPYEWSFSQLKDAALLTLEIQKRALARGMSLKDATAYNVQFIDAGPIFIDTLSFEPYVEGTPWIAYRQFCSHFLAPLALMGLVDVRLGQLQRTNIDGIPLDLASRLLPGSTKLRPGLSMHIHMHARAQRMDGKEATVGKKAVKTGKTATLALVDSLEGTIKSLNWQLEATEWGDYYSDTNYSKEAMAAKHRMVGEFIDLAKPESRTCWDIGANTGEFSVIASERGYYTIALDGDPAAIEKGYVKFKSEKAQQILPLLIDLANPSPSQGWAGSERDSLVSRGPAGLALGLALVHHLAIGNNVPLPLLAQFFAQVGEWLIIEFVPKSDSQVRRLLHNREDIFSDYDSEGFEEAFKSCFDVVRSEPIPGTERTLYLMRRR